MAASMGSTTIVERMCRENRGMSSKEPTSTCAPEPIGRSPGHKQVASALFKKRYELLKRSGKIDQLDLKNPKEDITLMELGETELAGCFYQAALHVTKRRKRTAIKMIRIWYYQHETDGEKLGCNKELLATGDDLRKRSGYPVVRISCKDNEFSEFNIYAFARHLTGGQFDDKGPLVVDCICTDEYYYYVPAYRAQLQSMQAACPPFTQEVVDSD